MKLQTQQKNCQKLKVIVSPERNVDEVSQKLKVKQSEKASL